MIRSIPPSLAPVLEDLELERPRVVATREIASIAARHGIRTPAKLIAHRLAERGWLLSTGVRGVWEFAPAERAGAYSDGGSLLALRAVLVNKPPVRPALALGSALWWHNLSERAPDLHEVAVPAGASVSAAIQRNFRVVRFKPNLQPREVQGVPVHRPATILVHLASHPAQVRSWSAVLERLGDLVRLSTEEDLRRELRGRPTATQVRLAYLLSGVAPDVADRLGIEPAGKVWFGPRRKVRHYDSTWRVADTVLPVRPSELASESGRVRSTSPPGARSKFRTSSGRSVNRGR